MGLTVISLGAGVQSTTLALMAAQGEVPMPDCAIFADTGWEPRAVYDHLAWLEGVLPFPVHRVSQGNLREAVTAGGFSSVPFFTEGGGMGPRQCTYQFKLRPIHKKVRELLGGKTPKGGATMLIGISYDEMTRMKDSRVQYMVNRFPLVELEMRRHDCLNWMERRGYPKPPRSACLGCPFKRDGEWRQTRDGPPDEWEDTLAADRLLRQEGRRRNQYMHASRKPLDEVDFSSPEDCGQLNFLSECEGMCGV